MSQTFEDEDSIRSYLLGKLSLEEQQRLEERLLTDNKLFEQLQVIEEDLIDDYVAGTLPASDLERADKHLLSAPQRRQDVRFARAMSRYVSERSAVNQVAGETEKLTQGSSWWQRLSALFRIENPLVGFALASLLLISVLACLALWLRSERLQRQFDQLSSARNSPIPQPGANPQLATYENDRLAEELRQEREQRLRAEQALAELQNQNKGRPPAVAPSPTRQPAFFTVALTPGSVRGAGEMVRFSPPVEATTIQLRLALPAADYQRYRAVIETDEGQSILSRSNLRAIASGQARSVVLSLPATLLKPGDYQLKLSGVTPGGSSEDVASYTFRILPK